MQQTPRSRVSSLSNYYSGLYGPTGPSALLKNISHREWRTAADALRGPSWTGILQLQPMEEKSAWVAGFEQGLCAAQYWTDRFFSFGNWYQPVSEGGFNAYWERRSSALKNTVERGRRRLAKAGAWRIDICCQDTNGLHSAIAAYADVYAQSWKPAEACPDFIPALARTAAHEGWLRLGILWLNDTPLAAQVWLVHGGKANIYKLAYVRGQEKFSPGSVLTAALMQHAMDVDGVQEVDYLNGDDAYKRDWMDRRRERIGLVAFDKRHWKGWLGAGWHFGGRCISALKLKQWSPCKNNKIS